jgi:hypothetical protein
MISTGSKAGVHANSSRCRSLPTTTYQVVRLIRLLVERWDRAALTEQESIVGRDKVSGAPLGLDPEEADPEYADDPEGRRIPLDAHIRLARPRDAATERQRMLRKGFNFQKGFDGPACSTRAWRSFPTSGSWPTSSQSSSGLPASGSRSTRSPSVGASSSCCPAHRTPRTGSAEACWTREASARLSDAR